MKISRVLHAGYVFEDADTRILFDPIFENPFSENCFAFPSVNFDIQAIRKVKFDAVFISHFHDDHCSFESLDLLNRDTPIFIYCIHDDLFELVRRLGFKSVRSLEIDSPVNIGGFSVTARRALDADVDSILQIQYGNLKVLNVVDSLIDPSDLEFFSSEGPWDVVLWPFQAMREVAVIAPSRFTDTQVEIPQEWISELRVLKPRIVVPSSCQFIHEDWSWYNQALFPITYRDFQAEVGLALPDCKIIRMNPSESFALTATSFSKAASLTWVTPVGEQNLDYDYKPEAKRQTTAEIATHFAALDDEQLYRVLKFCSFELLERYRSLEPTSFFERARIWRLSLFDETGGETRLLYKVENSFIQIASEVDLQSVRLAWVTEVPIAKVYSALERGEALTSMYIRVNDFKFSSEVEEELSEMDVLEDPLIRTLFNGRFGAYQREQLKRLGASHLIKREN